MVSRAGAAAVQCADGGRELRADGRRCLDQDRARRRDRSPPFTIALKEAAMANPLSRREVLKFGAYTTVGGVLTPGVSLAQAIMTDTKGITARDVPLTVGGATIPAYDARPEAQGRYPVVVVISGFTGNNEQN